MLEISTSGPLRRPNMRQRAKFREDRSNYSGDMANFRFFKMAAVMALPITLASRFYNSLYYRTSRDVTVYWCTHSHVTATIYMCYMQLNLRIEDYVTAVLLLTCLSDNNEHIEIWWKMTQLSSAMLFTLSPYHYALMQKQWNKTV